MFLLFLLNNMIYAQNTVPPVSSFHSQIKEKFFEGGWQFMTLTLICLVLGLMIFLKKLIHLHQMNGDHTKILKKTEEILSDRNLSGIPKSLEEHKGIAASIFIKSLDALPRGFNKVQENIESHISVQRGRLEDGLPWLTLFISLAPMLGFMGTVLGMIQAFNAIALLDASQGMNAGVVASGIKVALITTVSGLIIAVVLQLFFNYLKHKIEIFINDLEDTSSYFLDLLILYKMRG